MFLFITKLSHKMKPNLMNLMRARLMKVATLSDESYQSGFGKDNFASLFIVL